jgi:N-acyl-D-amino-acid deacylase
MYKTIIKNGILIDGTGALQKHTDIALDDQKIIEIGDLHDEKAKNIIDAQGMYVTPGFVDIQNHSDAYLAFFEHPQFENLVAQGITTIIVGNCGASLAPLLSRDALLAVQKWHNVQGVNTNWISFDEYLNEIGKKTYGTNVGSLVGYSTLRRGIVGDELRSLKPDELTQIIHTFRQSMKDGAFGLSSGLSYAHEAIIGESELLALAEVVAEEQGLFSVHLRSEAAEVMESLAEALNFAVKAKQANRSLNLKISHFKVRGKNNWHLLPHAIEQLENFYQKLGDIHFDLYPYDFTWQVLYGYLPRWSYEGGREMLIRNLKDPLKRAKIIAYLNSKDINYSELYIASTALVMNVAGKRVGEIASKHETSSEEALLAIIENGGSDVLAFEQNIDFKQVEQLLVHPLAMVSTDGSAFGPENTVTQDLVHPRCFGTMPAFLQFALQKKTIAIEEAVHKITGIPAGKVGLKDRGTLKVGNFADITIFSPEVAAHATMQDPFRFPTGIEYVFTNGEMTIEKGKHTGVLPGLVLRKKN